MTTWSSITWTTARAGGITAYVLLSLAVVLGLALSMRWQRPTWPRLLTNELHNYLTLLSLVFIGVHSLAVLLDPYTNFGLQDVLIPFASGYRTLWLSLGIIGSYLAVAIWISTQLRSRIGFSAWRKLHYATFLVYLGATLHGIGTGSDTRTFWTLALYGISATTVGGLLAARFLQPTRQSADGHPLLAGATLFSMLLGLLWTVSGPLQPGWAAANNGAVTPSTSASVPAPQNPSGVAAPSDTQHQSWHHDEQRDQGGWQDNDN